MEKKLKIGLLPRVIIAILLGLFLGYYLPAPAVRIFLTFNGSFSQFLGFMIPLIIIGLVTPAIAGIGKDAGKLLLATVAIAYIDTIVAGVPFDDRFDGRQYAAYRQGNRTGTLLLHHHTGHDRRDEQSGIFVHRRSQHCLRWLAHDGKPFQ